MGRFSNHTSNKGFNTKNMERTLKLNNKKNRQFNLKMGKTNERYLTKQEIWMANNHMTRF